MIKNDFIIEELALVIDEIADVYNMKLNISNSDDLIKNLIKPIPCEDLYLNMDNVEEISKNQIHIDQDIYQEDIKNKHTKFYNITASNGHLINLMGLSEYSAKIGKLSKIIDDCIDLNKSIIFTTENLNSTKNF